MTRPILMVVPSHAVSGVEQTHLAKASSLRTVGAFVIFAELLIPITRLGSAIAKGRIRVAGGGIKRAGQR